MTKTQKEFIKELIPLMEKYDLAFEEFKVYNAEIGDKNIDIEKSDWGEWDSDTFKSMLDADK